MSEKVTLRLSTPNGGEDSVFKGDPLNLYVSVHCHGPLEAENHNDSIELDIQELMEKLSREEIEKEDYEKKLEDLESKKIKIDYPTIGSIQQPWFKSIKFYNQETNHLLNWEFVSTFTNPEEPVIQFETDSSAHTGFLLSPDTLENISQGTYRIVAKIEDVESNSIRISISHEKEDSPSEEKISRKVEYLLGAGVLNEALKEIQGILVQTPESVRGHMLMGDYHEANNDRDAALESYIQARELYKSQNPDAYEPPELILQKITELSLRKSKQE
jgi:hypothetical protein